MLARVVVLVALLSWLPCSAATLYATTLRSEVGAGSEIAGNLYVIDPANAAATLVGAIRLDGSPIGVAAIAAHPITGVLYGITAGISKTIPPSLVTIDLEQGRAEITATLGTRGTDIGFGIDGTLYMWAPDLHKMVKVDLATGAIAAIGNVELAGGAGGGIAIDQVGSKALVALGGAGGTIDTIDLASGEATKGATLTGAPYAASIDNLTYAPDGTLYAVNSNGGAPSKASLVTIDAKTGAVKAIGALPDDVRGLIFARQRPREASTESMRVWTLVGLGVVAAATLAYAITRS
jgi:DNA-binding beta-propeller fold protein YncE